VKFLWNFQDLSPGNLKDFSGSWCLGGKYLALLLHCFSHAHRPAGPTLAVYHLPAFTRSHPNQESALAPPLNLTLAMIFHALSPILKNQSIARSGERPVSQQKTTSAIIHHTCPNEKTLSLADFLNSPS
jgi:hypothetical protein